MLLTPRRSTSRPCAADVLARLRRRRALPARAAGRPAGDRRSRRRRRSPRPRARWPRAAAASRRAADGIGLLAGAGVHPFAAGEGNAQPRASATTRIAREFGPVARRQLVFGLHVHVACRGAGPRAGRLQRGARAPAGARRARRRTRRSTRAPTPAWPRSGPSSRPAAAPGRPARVRRRGRRSPTRSPGARERRVPRRRPVVVGGAACTRCTARSRCASPDTQATVADTAAIAAVVHALVATLAERHDAGEPARARADLADRREPLVGLPARRRAAPGRRARAGAPRRCAEHLARAARRARAGGAARWAARRAGATRATSSSARGPRRRAPLGRGGTAADAGGRGSSRHERVYDRVARRPCPHSPRRAAPCPQPSSTALAAPPGTLARRPAGRSPSPTRSPTTTCISRCTAATSCTTAASTGVDERWEWDPGAARAARAAGGASSRPALRDALAGWTPPPADAATMDLALRAIADADDGPSLSRHLETHGTLDAVPRVPHPPLGLPAQGGRPALVGDRRACRARRRPRWSRSRPTSTAAATPRASTRSCSPTRWRRSASTPTYGAYLDVLPGRDAGDRQPDVAASACTGATAARSSATSRCSR